MARTLRSTMEFHMIRLGIMGGVRSYGNPSCPNVELSLNDVGRVVIRAFNEAGFSRTEVDLYDLLSWLRSGSSEAAIDNGHREHNRS